MNFPKMIIFDYGFTLLHEPCFDSLRAERAIFKYVVENPLNLTPEAVNKYSTELFNKWNDGRKIGCERQQQQFQRLINEYLGLKLSISDEESEEIYFENLSAGSVMPGAEAMLAELANKGIRSGVISNISFSQRVLKKRIDRLLPANAFEFIIASSEYGIRKPDPMIFQLALRKAGLAPEEVWFCGDNVEADVAGAYGVGMHPVWYDNLEMDKTDFLKKQVIPENCPGLEVCSHIHHWRELADILNNLKGLEGLGRK